MDPFDFRPDQDMGAERRVEFGGKAVPRDRMVLGQIVAVPADGGPFGQTQGMIVQRSPVLLIRMFQRPAGAKNRHDDNALAKIRPVVYTKSTGGPAFGRSGWPEFLSGLFGF